LQRSAFDGVVDRQVFNFKGWHDGTNLQGEKKGRTLQELPLPRQEA
jgi:hypothetical protein